MLNSLMNYPYPVLKKFPDDYKTSIFTADINNITKRLNYRLF